MVPLFISLCPPPRLSAEAWQEGESAWDILSCTEMSRRDGPTRSQEQEVTTASSALLATPQALSSQPRAQPQ